MTDRDEGGYRRRPVAGGPMIRADVVDVYVFRRRPGGVEFLQLRRTRRPLDATWQPIMGHCEAGETATACALRELREEAGLGPGDPALRGVWALEQVHPFFLAAIDAVVLSPRFAAEADPAWEPTLNAEHDAARWVPADRADAEFMWPGQRAAIREALAEIVPEGMLSRDRLRVWPL